MHQLKKELITASIFFHNINQINTKGIQNWRCDLYLYRNYYIINNLIQAAILILIKIASLVISI